MKLKYNQCGCVYKMAVDRKSSPMLATTFDAMWCGNDQKGNALSQSTYSKPCTCALLSVCFVVACLLKHRVLIPGRFCRQRHQQQVRRRQPGQPRQPALHRRHQHPAGWRGHHDWYVFCMCGQQTAVWNITCPWFTSHSGHQNDAAWLYNVKTGALFWLAEILLGWVKCCQAQLSVN
jgi:hypothetical protein